MRKTTKIIILTIFAIVALTLKSTVHANYQIIYQNIIGNYAKSNGKIFIENVRGMEANGQVMGLNENSDDLNEDLTSISSNRIDVHLIKNTEYGAVILLSASAEYGKDYDRENDDSTLKTTRYIMSNYGLRTTTGNAFGVYMDELTSSSTWVAATAGGYMFPENTNSRYINRYTGGIKLDGDALLKWHNSSNDNVASGYSVARGSSNSAFYITNVAYAWNNWNGYSRAAVVCGAGF